MNKIISDILNEIRKGNSDFNSGIDAAFATLKQLKNKTKSAGISMSRDNRLHKPKTDIEDESSSEADIKDLMDKAQAVRDKSKDLIDDNDELTQNTDKDNDAQEHIKKELQDIEKKAKEIQQELKGEENTSEQTLDKVNQELDKLQKRQERINKIKNFWDDPKNIKDFNSDFKLKREIEKAKKSATKRNYAYKPASISEIVRDLVNTLKKASYEYRDSDYEHVNPNAEYYDYVTPGRFTNTKQKIPNVIFYFDMSGSWCCNAKKIAMGKRIEEALKKLHQQKKINLACFDFAEKTAPSRADEKVIGSGNSDAPFPHAINLVKLKELDNVIIMTDSDPQVSEDLNVPGMAWLLFYDNISQSIIDHTKTKNQKNKKIYMIQH